MKKLCTVDRHARLVREASQVFDEMGLVNITAMVADGSHGLPDQAPFDRILVTAAAEDPPGPLLAQLKIGGIMVLAVTAMILVFGVWPAKLIEWSALATIW